MRSVYLCSQRIACALQKLLGTKCANYQLVIATLYLTIYETQHSPTEFAFELEDGSAPMKKDSR